MKLLFNTHSCVYKKMITENICYIVTNANNLFIGLTVCVQLLLFWSVLYHPLSHLHSSSSPAAQFLVHCTGCVCISKQLMNIWDSYDYIIFHGKIYKHQNPTVSFPIIYFAFWYPGSQERYCRLQIWPCSFCNVQ